MSITKKLKLSYPKMIALGFLTIITIGTILLLLPISTRSGESAGLITALFTATSATCVTGLVVVDTYLYWSVFGQIVIMTLIQIGGLGFMTVITMFSFFLKRKIGLGERSLQRESINTMHIGGVIRLTKKILIGTFIFESVGALLLATRFIPKLGFVRGAFTSLFTSVSAFCNAGFDLTGRYEPYASLIPFQNDVIINFTVMALIVIGGIGFFVWDDIYTNKCKFAKYKLHTKIVLCTTTFLIVFGAVIFFLLEGRNETMKDMNFFEKVMASLFASITPRTAGFNTIDLSKMTPGSKILTDILMFIGGSPGSTAGGIKTTTFAVLVLCTWQNIRNKSGANAFHRRLEATALSQATSVATINMTMLITATLLICIAQPHFHMSDILMETFSAIGTVGLSTGITRDLSTFSRLIIILLMYSGRVGGLSFAMTFAQKSMKPAVQNPVEKINIG